MRHLKIASTFNPYDGNKQFKKLLAQANQKYVGEAQEAILFEKIRKGNREAILKLVDSSEITILSIIKTFPKNSHLLLEMINVAKDALIRFAEKEMNNSGREIFFSYKAWWIRQSILQFINNNREAEN